MSVSNEHSARHVAGIRALSCLPLAPGESENARGRDREAIKPETQAQVFSFSRPVI